MNFNTLVICLVAVASFGQNFNFDDYFEDLSAPEITQTVQTEMPTTTSKMMTTSTAMIVRTTTTTILTKTTPIPTKTTPIPTKTTQTTTTTTMMPTVTTMTTTKVFDANDTIHIRFQPSVFSLLEQLVNQAFERLEQKFDNISSMLTPPTTTSSTTTTTVSTTTDVIDRLANEDVFSEFDEVLKKKDKKPKVETEKLLMVTLGCAGAGLIVILLTTCHIYYCKRVNRKEVDVEKKDEEEDDNDKDKKERKVKLHIYEDVTEMKTLSPIPHADSESGEEDIYSYDEQLPPTVAIVHQKGGKK